MQASISTGGYALAVFGMLANVIASADMSSLLMCAGLSVLGNRLG